MKYFISITAILLMGCGHHKQTPSDTITLFSNDGGTLQIDQRAPAMYLQMVTGPRGQVIHLTATPRTGWHLKSWTGTDDDTVTGNINAVTIHPGADVHVVFAENMRLRMPVGNG